MHTHAILPMLASFALVAAGHVAAVHASPQGTSSARPAVMSTHTASRFEVWPDGPNAVESAPSVILVREVRIVGNAPRSRVWTCGPVEANRIGGSQRTCEWVRP
jgi:hypothetical protein